MTGAPRRPPVAPQGSPDAPQGSPDSPRASPGAVDGPPGDVEGARTFEDLLAELESVTDRLAGGELGIEAATDLYERAERLHALAAARLEQVRDRVERLRSDPAGPAA